MMAGTARSDAQHRFAAALLDPRHAGPPGLRTWNGSDPAARLAVYRNNVVSSLVDALADTFPVVQHLVGCEFFRAMAAVFVRQAPPRSPVLAHYGQGFASFVAGFEPARELPYLADVARLEFARLAALHAADAEPVAKAALSAALASGDHMGALRLVLHPSVNTLASRHAVVSLWAAHQRDDDSAIASIDIDRPERALILRHGLEVLVLPAPGGALEFVAAVQAGQGLADAAAQAAASAPAFDLTATLSTLLAHDALSSIYLPTRLSS